MKKIIIEVLSILTVSVVAAIIFNQVSGNSISILKKYKNIEPVERTYNVEMIDIEVFTYYRSRGGTIVLDARPAEDFLSGHIPGANSFSVGKFDTLFSEQGQLLKLGKTIIVYCSGPDCKDSSMLALLLLKKGIKNIFVFKGGMEEWTGSGYEIIRDNSL